MSDFVKVNIGLDQIVIKKDAIVRMDRGIEKSPGSFCDGNIVIHQYNSYGQMCGVKYALAFTEYGRLCKELGVV